MGMVIDSVTEGEAISAVLDGVDAGRGGWVVTPNLDHLRRFCRASGVREIFEQADLVLADGMPLVWASRLQRTPLPERVAGSDLIGSLTAEAARRGRSIFLLGGNPGTAEMAARRLRESNPALKLAGTLCPPVGFEPEPAELERVTTALYAAQPDIVYVGLGFPKQERLIAQIKHRFPTVWFVGVGVSLSFVSGEIARAPRWMRRLGLEWVHRLAQEPRRLFHR